MLTGESLSWRMTLAQHLELADDVAGQAGGEIGIDPVFDGADPHLGQPVPFELDELFVGELLERWPGPEVERGPQGIRRGFGVALRERPAGFDLSFESGDVVLLGIDVQAVAGSNRLEQRAPAALPIGVERRPQARHIHTERVVLAVTLVAPQFLEDAVDRQRLVVVREQYRQHGLLPGRTEVDLLPVAGRGESTERSKLHVGHQTTPRSTAD